MIGEMRRKHWVFMVVVILVMFAAVAYADDTNSEIGKTIDSIWSYLWKIVGIALAGLIAKAISKLGKKFGIEFSEKQRQQITDFAIDSISYVEESFAKKAKEKVKFTSIDKFNKAVEMLCSKVPYLTEAQAREWIVATLPKCRAYIETKVPQ